MIYDDAARRRSDRGDRGRVLREAAHRSRCRRGFRGPVDDPLFTYLRTSQRHAADLAPWLAAADIVIVGEPGRAPEGADPLVTVSITAVGHGGPDDGLVLTDEVLQARAAAVSPNHGHADRPPLTVGGRLGEYVTGAYAALGAATAWQRASRTGTPEKSSTSRCSKRSR